MIKATSIESPIKHLKEKLGIDGDFLPEWRRLSNEDREELKELAKEDIAKLKEKEQI